MAKIDKIALTKLLKLELPQFVKLVTACVEKHNPKALKLQDAHEMLKDQRNKMKLLVAPYGSHPLTEQIHQIHLKRLKFAAAITLQMNMFRKLDFEDSRELVRIAHPMVKDHLHYLRQNNRVIIDRTIDVFFKQLEDNPNEHHALEMLGLKYCLDELRSANDEHCKLSTVRSKQLSERPKIDSSGIQKEAQYVLRAFFEQINFFQFTYRDVDYTPLISELNRLIARFTGLINTRATRGETRKKKAEARTANIDIQTDVTPIESMPQAQPLEVNKPQTVKEREVKSENANTAISYHQTTREESCGNRDTPKNLIRISKLSNKRGTS